MELLISNPITLVRKYFQAEPSRLNVNRECPKYETKTATQNAMVLTTTACIDGTRLSKNAATHRCVRVAITPTIAKRPIDDFSMSVIQFERTLYIAKAVSIRLFKPQPDMLEPQKASSDTHALAMFSAPPPAPDAALRPVRSAWPQGVLPLPDVYVPVELALLRRRSCVRSPQA